MQRDESDLSFAGACDLLGVSGAELLRRMSEEKLPGRLVGGEWRFVRAELEAWAERGGAAGRGTRARTPGDRGPGSPSGDR